MPGYIIHLAEATLALRQIMNVKEREEKNSFYSREWERRFLYGALLPDSVGGVDKKISHFWNEKDIGKILVGPDLGRFKGKYGEQLKNYRDNPMLLGYYNHLYTDWDFFLNYIPSKVQFLDEKMEVTNRLEEVVKVIILKDGSVISIEELFSEQYLYGDYTLLNKRLIERYELMIPEFYEITHVDIPEISSGDMKKVINKLKVFIAESDNRQGQLMVFEEVDIEAYLTGLVDKIVNDIT